MSIRPRASWLGVAGGLLLIAVVVQLAVDARRADRALHRAEGRLASLQHALATGDDRTAAQVLRQLQADAATAHGATSSVLWDLAGAVPMAGRSPQQAAALTRSVQELADEALPRLLVATEALRPVLHGGGNQVDLGALRRTAPFLDAALDHVAAVDDDLRGLPHRAVLPPVASARDRLRDKVDRLTDVLRDAVAAVHVAPTMLGANGPRRYFVAFQNNAESRGTGGLVGAYAVLVADQGRLRVQRLGTDLELTGLPAPRLDLGADYRRLYGGDTHIIQNTNMSGHFPYAARQWLDMWQRRTGVRLDGALATDPVALSYLLGTTGPVTLRDGTSVTAADVVARTEQQSYVQYAENDQARKQYLVGVAEAVLARLLGAHAPARSGVLRAVAKAASERRFLVYSAHPAEQTWLEGTGVSGEVPEQGGPFAFLVVNNSAGNKIDYYLERSVRYELGRCRDGVRDSTLTLVLRNDVPPVPLPRFVVGRLDRKGPAGSTSVLLSAYVTQGAALRRATLDGQPVRVFAGTERGHPVFVLKVELPRAAAQTLVLHLREPAVGRQPVVLEQPLARPQSTTIHAAPC